PRVCGQLAQVGAQPLPELRTAGVVAPVGDAERADVAAGGPPTDGRREVDGTAEPGHRPFPLRRIRVEQQVASVRAEARERRVHADPMGRTRRGHRLGLPGEGRVGVEVDQIEAVLHHPQAELVRDDRGPSLRLGPALDGEAGVDSERVVRRAHPDPQSPRTAAAARTVSYHSRRTRSPSAAGDGSYRLADPSTEATAAGTSSPIPAALAARSAVP